MDVEGWIDEMEVLRCPRPDRFQDLAGAYRSQCKVLPWVAEVWWGWSAALLAALAF